MLKLIAVIPAHNECDTVGRVIDELRLACPDPIEAVVVDDGSTDSTLHVAKRAGATTLRLPVNLGYGAALRLGFRYAAGRHWDTALVLDADGQHIPTEVPTLLAARDTGADLVLGSRFHPDCPNPYPVSCTRRSAMRLAGGLLQYRHGVALTDPTSGFWALSRPCVELFAQKLPAGFLDNLLGLTLAASARMTITEVPVTMATRQGGQPSARGTALAYHYLRALVAVSIGNRS